MVFTEPKVGLPWSGPTDDDPSYHLLVAMVPRIGVLMQVIVEPLLGLEINLEEYMSVLLGVIEMSTGDDFSLIDSQVVERNGRTIGVSFHQLKALKFMMVVFREEGRLVLLSFNCFEGLFDSRVDEFWAIADSYEPAVGPDLARRGR